MDTDAQSGRQLAVGDLVILGGLTSEIGRQMNGRYGEVVELQENGRVGVNLYSMHLEGEQVPIQRVKGATCDGEAKSVKPENLDLKARTCDIFKHYLQQKAMKYMAGS